MTVIPETRPEQQISQETVKTPHHKENDEKLQDESQNQQQSSNTNSSTSLNSAIEKMDGGAIMETQHLDPLDNQLEISDKMSLSHSSVPNDFNKPMVQLYSSSRNPIQSQNE